MSVRQLKVLSDKMEDIMMNQSIMIESLSKLGVAYQSFAEEFKNHNDLLIEFINTQVKPTQKKPLKKKPITKKTTIK